MQTLKKRSRERIMRIGVLALSVLLLVLVLIALLLPESSQPALQPTLVPITVPEVPTQTQPSPTLPPNPYGYNDFQYENGYLTCRKGESVLGIDVSAHQGQIDWEQVASAGIRFVMIRVGYRGYETGNLVADAYAQENYQGAKDAGLQVGAYFFSQATNLEEAMEEANFFLEAIAHWELDMPVVYDWEYIGLEARTAFVDKRTVTNCTKLFCGRMKEAGLRPMLYFNRHQAEDFLYLEELTEYPFWLALYSDRMTYPHRLAMWQYTEKGKVPGIEGNVDIDLYFPDLLSAE